MKKFDAFWILVVKEFPDAKIVFKDESRLMSAIDIFLRFITLGLFKNFLQGFITTIGHTVYVPRDWMESDDTRKIVVIRHERVHMRQEKKYGRIWYKFLYLFALPAVFTYRAKFEREAYEETFRAYGELEGPDVLNPYSLDIDKYIRHFTGPNYFFMWPRKRRVKAWLYDTMNRVREEILSGKNGRI